MTQSIPLIDKQDGFELVRDTIAAILATETVAQVALATAQSKPNPSDWAFGVYLERINPWEAFLAGDLTPIVNVWFDSTTFDKASSNVATRQKTDPSRFNVDIYAQAESKEETVGHTPGDEAASKLAQHVAKLVRNILMHDKYKYLGLQGIVWRRWVGQITAFQPASGTQPLGKIAAVRLVLEVEHLETIDLEDHETLEIISIDMRHEPNGQIIAELDIDFGS